MHYGKAVSAITKSQYSCCCWWWRASVDEISARWHVMSARDCAVPCRQWCWHSPKRPRPSLPGAYRCQHQQPQQLCRCPGNRYQYSYAGGRDWLAPTVPRDLYSRWHRRRHHALAYRRLPARRRVKLKPEAVVVGYMNRANKPRTSGDTIQSRNGNSYRSIRIWIRRSVNRFGQHRRLVFSGTERRQGSGRERRRLFVYCFRSRVETGNDDVRSARDDAVANA